MTSSVRFASPPPGLEPTVDFVLEELQGAPGVYAMRAADRPGLRLFVIDAAVFLPDYRPALSADQTAALGVAADEHPQTLLVTSIGESGPTVNLAAPILVNPRTGAAGQVILDGHDLPLRHTLVAA